ncbi:MAG: 50S ribosomal protein L29 [Candidatus Dormibacteraeota bacterium]|uniref:Large ribosomal subunit protein uL29 n=1 Tax=Candidatus Nephthysia bennettiae TaxID=3127016 RepID=A0A934K9A2_9BACT|nr:50S ribosomal protein L29 [Candidatus Dormibacteraeota bacterium]MBJ7612019.1 50S ribosomal protein L29 [Candidatus Dormibacteraeota bacterium]
MKTEELRELDAEELGGRLKGARRELYELRFKLAVGQLDNHREIRKARKEIARILTVVHQRRLEAVDGEPLVSPRDDQEPAQVAAERSGRGGAEAAAEAGEPATPSAAVEIETEEAETPAPPASAGAAEGDVRPAEDAVEETDAEAGRAKRRRSRKAVNEDEG